MSPLISGLATVASLIMNAASSGSAKSGGSRRSGSEAAAEPSAVFTLSPQAEALAAMAGKGVMAAHGKPEGSVGAVQRNPVGAGAQAVSTALSGRPVSTQDFQELLAHFGADDTQKAQLTAGFDANQDGAISRDEFLQGLSQTRGPQSDSTFSQAVMQVMDRSGNADGRVGPDEFAALTAAFAAATSSRRAGAA